MIIGVTGYLCAGKDTLANYLEEKSFYHISLSNILRDELRKRKLPVTRENLIKLGNDLRLEFGRGVLALKALQRVEKDKNYVISSIGTVGEINVLKERKDCAIVFVNAPQNVRFERMKARKREKDPRIFEEFMKKETLENSGGGQAFREFDNCKKKADIIIMNDKTTDNFKKKINKMLQDLNKKMTNKRIPWDVYFMNIAKEVATRSNCMKRKVAAIIIKDKRIISTGYNGTPRGTRNCNEGGCERCNSYSDKGTQLSECVCSHGEENAIVQAAYHGISIKDTTLYTTFSPCLTCSKMIINAGIKEVVYCEEYPLSGRAASLLKEASIKLRKIKA